MTSGELEQHYATVDIEALEASAQGVTAADVQANPLNILEKIGPIYHAIRPFLDWADNFFLIPVKIRRAVTLFIQFMDGIFPQDQG